MRVDIIITLAIMQVKHFIALLQDFLNYLLAKVQVLVYSYVIGGAS
nr:MAG TPA: hypothetical protein [Caudoviricetes sp.]